MIILENNLILKDFKDIIKNSNRIFISGHVNPDGDATGASFALGLALKKIGKEPVLLLGNYSQKYNILEGKELVYRGDYSQLQGDLFISVDTPSIERLGQSESIFAKMDTTINFDHHISNRAFAKYNYVDSPVISSVFVVMPKITSALYCLTSAII